MSGPRSRGDRGPQPLNASLDALSDRLGAQGARELGRLFSRWDEIVGSAIAAHVRPVKLDNQALVVSVDHPAWATQVRYLGDDLLDRVAEVTGTTRPSRLDVRVGR